VGRRVAGDDVDGVGAVGHGDLPDPAAAGALHLVERVVALVGGEAGVAVAGVSAVVNVPPVGQAVAAVGEDESRVGDVAGGDDAFGGLEIDHRGEGGGAVVVGDGQAGGACAGQVVGIAGQQGEGYPLSGLHVGVVDRVDRHQRRRGARRNDDRAAEALVASSTG